MGCITVRRLGNGYKGNCQKGLGGSYSGSRDLSKTIPYMPVDQ